MYIVGAFEKEKALVAGRGLFRALEFRGVPLLALISSHHHLTWSMHRGGRMSAMANQRTAKVARIPQFFTK